MKLSELLEDRGKVVNRLTVPILMSTDAATRCSRAQEAVDKAKRRVEQAQTAEEGRMAQPRTAAAKRELEEAEAELTEANDAAIPYLVDFVVESVGSDDWEALVLAHPPTDEQVEKAGKDNGPPEFNPETFPLAAVGACLVDPEVGGLDDVRKLKASVPDVVWQQIFNATLQVNRGVNRVPLSLSGSAATRSSGRMSEPQPS